MAQVIREVTRSDEELYPKKIFHRQLTSPRQGNRFYNVVQRQLKGKPEHRLTRSDIPTALGRYLYDLTQAWDAMDYEADERLVRHSFSREAKIQTEQQQPGKNVRDKGRPEHSLHVRRTLDQSYFLTLDDTTHRDIDQVVYRQTKTRQEQNWEDNKKKTLPTEAVQSTQPPSQQPHENHISRSKRRTASNCTPQDSTKADSKRKTKTKLVGVTRVVMVDQLWMWILDERKLNNYRARSWVMWPAKIDTRYHHYFLPPALGQE